MGLLLLALPAAALAQSPPPDQAPHQLPTPAPRRAATPQPHHTAAPGHSPQPGHRSGSNAYSTRVNLSGDDVKRVLASPSASPLPTREPNSIQRTGVPSPDVFGTTHN